MQINHKKNRYYLEMEESEYKILSSIVFDLYINPRNIVGVDDKFTYSELLDFLQTYYVAEVD